MLDPRPLPVPFEVLDPVELLCELPFGVLPNADAEVSDALPPAPSSTMLLFPDVEHAYTTKPVTSAEPSMRTRRQRLHNGLLNHSTSAAMAHSMPSPARKSALSSSNAVDMNRMPCCAQKALSS